jgi:hypothetical protein
MPKVALTADDTPQAYDRVPMTVIRLFFSVIFLIATVQLCIAGQWGVAGLAFLIMALCVPKVRVRRA